MGIGTTPYEITFGHKPFNFPEYIVWSSNIDVVEDILIDTEETFQAIRKKLMKAQDAMKKHADSKRREVSYQAGDCSRCVGKCTDSLKVVNKMVRIEYCIHREFVSLRNLYI